MLSLISRSPMTPRPPLSSHISPSPNSQAILTTFQLKFYQRARAKKNRNTTKERIHTRSFEPCPYKVRSTSGSTGQPSSCSSPHSPTSYSPSSTYSSLQVSSNTPHATPSTSGYATFMPSRRRRTCTSPTSLHIPLSMLRPHPSLSPSRP